MRTSLIFCALLAAPLAACSDGPPTGQVVARIDGIDITRRDVLIELTANGAPMDVDTSRVQPALLEQIVARKLLAQEAIEQGIDHSPEFMGQERRNRELLLGAQLRQRLTDQLPQPSPAAVADYIARNRAALADRKMLHIDRIATPSAAVRKSLEELPTLDDAARWLSAHHLPFDRSTLVTDGFDLSSSHRATLLRPEGGLALFASRGTLFVDRLLIAIPAPVAPADQPAFARDQLRRKAADAAFARRYKDLRRAATYEVQSGLVSD